MAATWGFRTRFWLLAARDVVDFGVGRRNGVVLAMMLAILTPWFKFERFQSGNPLVKKTSLGGKMGIHCG